jgi:moderate conductance mechanosensitive channel
MPHGMIRKGAVLATLLIAALLLGAAPARAAAGPGNTPAAEPAPTTGELRNLVKTLESGPARTKLIAELQALIAARQAANPVPVPKAAPTGFIESLAKQFQAVAADFVAIAGIAHAAPRLAGWIAAEAGSRAARQLWLGAFIRLIVIFGFAGLGAFGMARALRGPRRRLAAVPHVEFVRWLLLFLGALAVELVPLGVFGGVATLVLAILHPALPTRPVAMAVILAILKAQSLIAVLRVALLIRAPHILRLRPESRAYLFIWFRRFILWAIYGFAAAEIAWWFGAPDAVTALIERLVTLVLGGLAIVFVLQNRVAVAKFLRGNGHAAEDRGRRGNPVRALRNSLADSWHILAIIYIVGSFGTYFVDLHGGLGFVLRATAATVVILVGTGIALRLVRQLNERGFALRPEMRARYPGLEARANKYVPALILAISIVIYGVAALLLLQAWGLDVVAWLRSELVGRAAGSLASILLVVVIATVIWELASAAIERALGIGVPDRQAQVSARLRTLLPLVRSTVLIAIATVAGFIALSQLGIDIAPLLAGAGIIGIAVGFGSQALVKDVINGMFVLLENTLAVGEVVDVGSGHAGVVEAITIRTIKLRDAAGSVHTVPFSNVNAVTNLTRDFSFYVLDVGVAYEEDTDRVVAALQEIDADMRADPAFAPLMLEPIQIWGVDRFADSSVVVRARLKTKPIQQWNVGREFNRRMKHAFDAQGISFPYPHRTIDIVEKKAEGTAS